MKILNLHGYHGSPRNSAYKALEKEGREIVSPELDYDSLSADEVLEKLRGLIAVHSPDFIVGTSLGGFYAALICAETGLRTVLVNPCLMPFMILPCRSREFIAAFGRLAYLDAANVSCIVGDDDELLGDHKFTETLLHNERFRRVAGGGHSGATLPLGEYFDEVLCRK
ncbi:YqiA/YcfP family alpha/beta fold hydrolase [Ruminococcus sp.]|uniref:YqiA/YcfP family alpha/beta fold hydrolase n=1 Tax=Ruminococcus sp. TaxID=41978 RepID=UPI0025E64EC8|nr:YqiA/YcfP family alpha/beta fold hydrolase [Ruminococcus sp.]MBQ8965711.1 hypothetical protein [Ruminococcus sp.]